MSPARHFARICRGQSLGVLLRRTVGGTLLAAYVVVAAGIPLPTISPSAKSGELFPCASSGCGCDSAEKCWRSCCCHTLAERLAWAEENGVKPPAFALVEAKRAGLVAAGRPLAAKVHDSMATYGKPATPSCCRAKATCCKSPGERPCCSSRTENAPSNDDNRYVVAYRALGCHGQSFNWLAAVPTLIVVEPELAGQLPLVAWLGPHSSEVAAGIAAVPTPPPPERA